MFHSPKVVDIDRRKPMYLSYAHGHKPKKEEISTVALTAMVKFAATMRNLRRGREAYGNLKKVEKLSGWWSYMTPDWAEFVPFPTSKSIAVYSRFPSSQANRFLLHSAWKVRYDDWEGKYVPRKDDKSQGHDLAALYKDSGSYKRPFGEGCSCGENCSEEGCCKPRNVENGYTNGSASSGRTTRSGAQNGRA